MSKQRSWWDNGWDRVSWDTWDWWLAKGCPWIYSQNVLRGKHPRGSSWSDPDLEEGFKPSITWLCTVQSSEWGRRLCTQFTSHLRIVGFGRWFFFYKPRGLTLCSFCIFIQHKNIQIFPQILLWLPVHLPQFSTQGTNSSDFLKFEKITWDYIFGRNFADPLFRKLQKYSIMNITLISCWIPQGWVLCMGNSGGFFIVWAVA